MTFLLILQPDNQKTDYSLPQKYGVINRQSAW